MHVLLPSWTGMQGPRVNCDMQCFHRHCVPTCAITGQMYLSVTDVSTVICPAMLCVTLSHGRHLSGQRMAENDMNGDITQTCMPVDAPQPHGQKLLIRRCICYEVFSNFIRRIDVRLVRLQTNRVCVGQPCHGWLSL